MNYSVISAITILSLNSLFSVESFRKVSTNVEYSELNRSNLQLDHQLNFRGNYDDLFMLQLTHAIGPKNLRNEVGLGYRKYFNDVGLGANFYYMNGNKPGLFLHQVSPGLEFLYSKFQLSYNAYFPTSSMKMNRTKIVYSNPVSEFGVCYRPSDSFKIGVLPFYDHKTQEWGFNSCVSYLLRDRFEFGISPHLSALDRGLTFTFGVNFGDSRSHKSQPMHRSNAFSYSVEKRDPRIFYLDSWPDSGIVTYGSDEVIEEAPQEQEKAKEAEPVQEKPKGDLKAKSWWNYFSPNRPQ